MLESLFALALCTGGIRALRLRHRWAMAGFAVIAYLLLADLIAVFAVRVSGAGGVFGVFANIFIGPAALPLRAPGFLPLPELLISHPLAVRAARCCVCCLVAVICLRESSRLNPLLPRAYALDGLAMPFVGAGVVDAVEAVLLLWAQLMLGADAAVLTS